MDLAGYLFEANVGVEARSHFVLRQRFDLGAFHPLAPHMVQGMFHETATNAFALVVGEDGDIGDAADFAFGVDSGADISDDLASLFPDKDVAGVVPCDVVVYVAQFAPAPIAAADGAELGLDIAVNGDAVKADGSDLFESVKVLRAVGAYHAL